MCGDMYSEYRCRVSAAAAAAADKVRLASVRWLPKTLPVNHSGSNEFSFNLVEMGFLPCDGNSTITGAYCVS